MILIINFICQCPAGSLPWCSGFRPWSACGWPDSIEAILKRRCRPGVATRAAVAPFVMAMRLGYTGKREMQRVARGTRECRGVGEGGGAVAPARAARRAGDEGDCAAAL